MEILVVGVIATVVALLVIAGVWIAIGFVLDEIFMVEHWVPITCALTVAFFAVSYFVGLVITAS